MRLLSTPWAFTLLLGELSWRRCCRPGLFLSLPLAIRILLKFLPLLR